MNYLEFKLLCQRAEDRAEHADMDVDACDIKILVKDGVPYEVTLIYRAEVKASILDNQDADS